MSLEQLATFLARALGLEPVSTNMFADVDPASVHAGNSNAVAAAGITNGCNGGDQFCPSEHVTRGAMATFVTAAFDLDRARDRYLQDGQVVLSAAESRGETADTDVPSNPEPEPAPEPPV